MNLPKNYNELNAKQRRLVREAYVNAQDGFCYYCKNPLDKDPPDGILQKKLDMRLFPIGFLNHPIHLHHSHVTGMTIGAVHAYCNGVLFQYHGE